MKKYDFVFRPPTKKLQAEYGSCSEVRFAEVKTTLRDFSEKEISVPECKICNKQMSPVIGKECVAWHCYDHGFANDLTN